jgi:1-acyl-sn-glycerol-3-phosphate acyltransferase
MLVTVLGREHIEKKKSYIVVSNHQSHYDIFVLYGWLGIDLKWVIKKELRKVPVFGYAAEKGGNVLIDRSNPKEAYADLERARSRITGGTSLIILPEGTRSRDGSLGDFKKGAFQIALDLGLPILPVNITGTRRILPPGTFDLFPGRAVMRIHEPVEASRYDTSSMDRLIAEVRERILAGIEQDEQRA